MGLLIYIDTQRKKYTASYFEQFIELNNSSRVRNRGEPKKNNGSRNIKQHLQ